MSAEFIDTNLLIYAHDTSSPRKRQLSLELLERLAAERAGWLSTQVLLEFYAAATRKLGMSSSTALDVLDDLRAWPVYNSTADDVVDAARLSSRHSLSIWDAMVVQAALNCGCDVLWSEDLQDGRKFQTLVVRNPFG